MFGIENMINNISFSAYQTKGQVIKTQKTPAYHTCYYLLPHFPTKTLKASPTSSD
jgi:hypothetical protein